MPPEFNGFRSVGSSRIFTTNKMLFRYTKSRFYPRHLLENISFQNYMKFLTINSEVTLKMEPTGSYNTLVTTYDITTQMTRTHIFISVNISNFACIIYCSVTCKINDSICNLRLQCLSTSWSTCIPYRGGVSGQMMAGAAGQQNIAWSWRRSGATYISACSARRDFSRAAPSRCGRQSPTAHSHRKWSTVNCQRYVYYIQSSLVALTW
jgi:hypothetical protein